MVAINQLRKLNSLKKIATSLTFIELSERRQSFQRTSLIGAPPGIDFNWFVVELNWTHVEKIPQLS